MIRRFLAAAALVLSLAGFTPGEQSTNIYYATQFAGAVSKQLCTWDATHDVADCINAAIAAANQAGGGIVELPAGTYGMSVPIPIAASNIGLRCNHTALKWLGAAGARMVSLISPYGDTTKKRLVGNSIVGCEFQGNGAADGLYMSSITGWDLRNLTFRGPFNGGKVVAFDAIPALEGSTFGETTSLQNGTLRGLWLDNSTGTSTGIYLGAYMTGVGAHGNASYFQIDDYVVIGNTSMTGIHAWGADNIRFGMGRVFNHGGIGVDMDIGVLTTLVTTGTTDSTISVSVASTAGLSIGQAVSGMGIPNGTHVAAIAGSTITLSQAATASASGVALTFKRMFGSGDIVFEHLSTHGSRFIARGQTTQPSCGAFASPMPPSWCTAGNRIMVLDQGNASLNPEVEPGANLRWDSSIGIAVSAGGFTSDGAKVPGFFGLGGFGMVNVCRAAYLAKSQNTIGYLCPGDGELFQFDTTFGDRYILRFNGPSGSADLLMSQPEGTGRFFLMPKLFANGGVMANLVGSCTDQPAGTLWNNGGVVNVCP